MLASVVEVAPWHSVQLFVPPPSTVFQVYPKSAAELCPLLWHWLTPQVPNVPPLTATALAAAGAYVKVPLKVTDPFACVATDAVAWQSLHAAPSPVSVVRCGPCELLASVVEVALWHSVQLFVPPPSCVPHVYGRIAVVLCPLLWQRFTPQVPTVGYEPLYVNATFPETWNVPLMWFVAGAVPGVPHVVAAWQSEQTFPSPSPSSRAPGASAPSRCRRC